mgnify:CR=1 FL=1
MDEPNIQERAETALIEQQKKITVTGVASVDGFTPREIRITLEGGRAVIAGENLKIVSFSKANGNFSATGKIAGIRFFGKSEKLTKRLFG